MNRKKVIAISLGGVLTAGFLAGCGTSTPKQAASAIMTPSAQTPGTTSSAAVLPISANPIVNNSTAPGLDVTYAAVENNVDPATGNTIGDQLELTLRNTTGSAMTGIEVYYEMTDVVTNAKEGYYQKLTGITIAPNQETTVYFDGSNQLGHFPENQFSLYRSSQNEVDFKIWVSAPGVKVAQATAIKSKGTGEKPGA